ncbi:MAG: hypothetical protein EZS28_029767 [Streblomastix strix]|uniref:Uncharacterized protein n=1 Tax=Streblomastix strix TaxID=222440 RepID=A0A5J4UY86_9EUKA|nr:MAG: hypothetical protein EZS28_029767 [Streblomastix strix]
MTSSMGILPTLLQGQINRVIIATTTPKFISSLVNLTQFKGKVHNEQSGIIQVSQQVRISICGGSEVENDTSMKQVLSYYNQVISALQTRISLKDYLELMRSAEEQTEQEGGLEEFIADIFSDDEEGYEIQNFATDAMQLLSNEFIDISNRSNYEYGY